MKLMGSFKGMLKELGITLPKDVYAFETKEGVRVAGKDTMGVAIGGKRGILAFTSQGITQGFILTLGRLAKRRIEVRGNLREIAEGKPFYVDEGDGWYVATHRGFPMFIVEVKEGKAYPKVSKGFKRKVVNELREGKGSL